MRPPCRLLFTLTLLAFCCGDGHRDLGGMVVFPTDGEVVRALPVFLFCYGSAGVRGISVRVGGMHSAEVSRDRADDGAMFAFTLAAQGGVPLSSGLHTLSLYLHTSDPAQPPILAHVSTFTLSLPNEERCAGSDSRVLLVGDFTHEHSWEGLGSAGERLVEGMTEAGLCVYSYDESRVSVEAVEQALVLHQPSVLVYARGHGLSFGQDDRALWDACGKRGVKSVAWLTDVHAGLSVGQGDGIWGTDFVVSPDGGEHASFAAGLHSGATHVFVGEGASGREEWGLGDGEGGAVHDVLVVGGNLRQEHVFGGERSLVVRTLREVYGKRFHHHLTGIRSGELPALLRSAKIVVVTSWCSALACTCPSGGFWGPEVYEAMARGAFVVTDNVEGLSRELINGTHLGMYERGDMGGLLRVVRYFLREEEVREGLRVAGHRHVVEEYGLGRRMEGLLGKLVRRERGQVGGTCEIGEWVRERVQAIPLDPGAGVRRRLDSGHEGVCEKDGTGNAVAADAGQGDGFGAPLAMRGGAFQSTLGELLSEADMRESDKHARVQVLHADVAACRGEIQSLGGLKVLDEDENVTRRAGLGHVMDGGWPERHDVFVALIREGMVSSDGLICAGGGQSVFAFDIHRRTPEYLEALKPQGCGGGEKVLKLGRALLVLKRWGNRFSHFMQDLAAITAFALHALHNDDPSLDPYIIFESDSDPNVIAVLGALAGRWVGSESVIMADTKCLNGHRPALSDMLATCKRYIHASELVVTETLGKHAMFSSPMPALNLLRRKLWDFVDIILGGNHSNWGAGMWGEARKLAVEVVLLGRGEDSACVDRCISNTEDLVQSLETFAEATWRGRALLIQPASTSLLQMALMIRDAKALVAAHGGQCFNAIFAIRNTVFIEIIPAKKTNDGPFTVHGFLSSLQLRHWAVPVEGAAHRTHLSDTAFTVNSTKVVLILEREFSHEHQSSNGQIYDEDHRDHIRNECLVDVTAEQRHDGGSGEEEGSTFDLILHINSTCKGNFTAASVISPDGYGAEGKSSVLWAPESAAHVLQLKMSFLGSAWKVHWVSDGGQEVVVDLGVVPLKTQTQIWSWNQPREGAILHRNATPITIACLSPMHEVVLFGCKAGCKVSLTLDGAKQWETVCVLAKEHAETVFPVWGNSVLGVGQSCGLECEKVPDIVQDLTSGVHTLGIALYNRKDERLAPKAKVTFVVTQSVKVDFANREELHNARGNEGGLGRKHPLRACMHEAYQRQHRMFRWRWRKFRVLGKCLVYTCSQGKSCGGFMDRLKGLLSTFLYALEYDLPFFIDFKDPASIDLLLEPADFDWRFATLQHHRHLEDWHFHGNNKPYGGFESANHSRHYEALDYIDKADALIRDARNLLTNLPQNGTAIFLRTNKAIWRNPLYTAQRCVDDKCNIRHAYPSPAAYLFRSLFKPSAYLRALIRSAADTLLPAQHRHLFLENHGLFGQNSSVDGWGKEMQRSPYGYHLIGVQIRSNLNPLWSGDPPGTSPDHIPSMLSCIKDWLSLWDIRVDRTYIFVAADHLPHLDAFEEGARLHGLDPQMILSLRPKVIAHLERSDPSQAAAGMPSLVLDATLLSRCESLFVTHGFGITAGEIGGIPPGRIIQLGTTQTPFPACRQWNPQSVW